MIAEVRADASNAPILNACIVTVPAEPLSVNAAVSWARGKLLTAGVPEGVVAQAVAVQLCVPAKFQYTVLAAGKVMPELPPQSPALVGELPVAAPVTMMSRKSQSVAEEIALTVRVRAVPNVFERRNNLFVADEPAQVSVPYII